MIMNNQHGSALIVTLFVVVILTVTVTEFLYETWVDRSLVSNFRDGSKGLYALTSGVEAARAIIVGDLRRDQKNGILIDTLKEYWAQPAIAIPLEDTFMFATITDEQSKININGLITPGGYPDEKYFAVFRRLLRNLELDENIADYARDWIDANEEGPAENPYYQSLQNPYRCKNARFDTVDELQMVRGVTPEVFARLRKFITITGGLININTAPREVLMALHDDITASMADDVVKERADLPFKDKGEIKRLAGFETLYPEISNLTDVRSGAFSLTASVTFNESRRVAHAIFYNRTAEKVDLLYFKVD